MHEGVDRLVRSRSGAGLVLVAFLAQTATPAWAQNIDAEGLFAEGVRLEADGKPAEACEAFEASNRIDPRAGTLIRIGHCHELLDHVASAWSAYKEALTRVKDPRKREIAAQRVATLEPRLSYLTVLVPADSRLDGMVVTRNGERLDAGLWNRAVPVDGGSYVIAVEAPDHEAWSTTVSVANQRDRVIIDVPRPKRTKASASMVSEPVVSTAIAPLEPTRSRGRRMLGVGLAAFGTGALVAGTVFGLQSRRLEANAYELCPDPRIPCRDSDGAQDLVARGASRATLANVAFGVGSAAVLGGVVVWVTARKAPRDTRPTVSIHVEPGQVGLELAARF